MTPFDVTAVPLDGVNLVEASAGTGKTHAITTLVVRLVIERALPIDAVLVVTFTEAATAELRERVRRRLAEALAAFDDGGGDTELRAIVAGRGAADRARVEQALRDVDEAAIFTLHGFCHRVLHDSAFDTGVSPSTELLTDATPLVEELVQDYWTTHTVDADEARVRLWQEHGCRPEGCRRLVEQVLRCPDMLVLPEAPPAEVTLDGDAFAAAWQDAGRLWNATSIGALLRGDAIDHRRYPYKSIDKWLSDLEAWFAGGAPPGPAPEIIHKLRPDALRGSVKRGCPPPFHPFFDAVERVCQEQARYQEQERAVVLAYKHGLVAELRRELPRRKAASKAMGFEDLLTLLRDALGRPGSRTLAESLRRRYPAALIDEFQDTDPVQWDIARRLWPDGTLFLIGDPKQAIYSFRGADVFTYLDAARRVGPEQSYTMADNWRSDTTLVRAVNTLFGGASRPMFQEGIGFPEVRAAHPDRFDPGPLAPEPLCIAMLPRPDEKRLTKGELREMLPRFVAADISRLLRSGATIEGRTVDAGDVAVLTRSNVQAFEVQRGLARLGIPSVVLGDQSVFESQEAGEIALVLAAVADPTDDGAIRAALTTDLMGVAAHELAAMRQESGAAWDEHVARARGWNATWVERGFVQMFRALMDGADIHRRVLGLPGGERRLTNLLHLMELLHTAASGRHLGPAALCDWLALQQKNSHQRPDAAQIRLESDERAVKITTIHKAKGLQYPVVYCPFAWDGTLLFAHEKGDLPYHDEQGRLCLQLGSDGPEAAQALARARHERMAESLRLLYVALTRAKHRCTIVWGAVHKLDTAALGYLVHPPPLWQSPGVDELEGHLSRLSDARMRADVDALCRRSGGAIGTIDADLDDMGEPFGSAVEKDAPLECRTVRRRAQWWWRTASFSQLVSGASDIDDGEGRDRDEQGGLVEAPAPGDEQRITLADFPRGARVGNFFHELFEHMDFRERTGRAELVQAKLAAYGLGADHAATVELALDELCATPLPAVRGKLRLGEVARSSRLDELEFHFPVASERESGAARAGTQLQLLFVERSLPPAERGVLTAKQLATVFKEHPSAALHVDYHQRVGALGFLPLEGYLKGYIDLVFEHRGRWYLCDYKTNHLGDTRAAYHPAALRAVMADHHYYLQYHLYAVALHRLLGLRLPGYRYDKHFGGVHYLFVRGMHPRSSGMGVFYERPPLGRIEALSELLARPLARRPALDAGGGTSG